MKKIRLAVILGALTVATLLGTLNASAADAEVAAPETTQIEMTREDALRHDIVAALSDMLKDGIITEDQTPALSFTLYESLKDAPYATGDGEHIAGSLESLVTVSLITKEQADAVEASMKTAIGIRETVTAVLDPLAADGIITSEQYQFLFASLYDALKSAPSYQGDYNAAGVLDSLVSVSLITEEQAGAVEQAMKPSVGGSRISLIPVNN